MRLLVAALAAVVVTACSISTPITPTPTAFGTRTPPGSPTSTAAGSPSGSAASPSSGPAVASDEELLQFAPKAGNGIDFQYDPETTDEVAADPRLAADLAALAIGLFTVTGQSPPADFVVLSVARLRDPAADEEWFRGYRDSYDESACTTAGGVVRHAETTINGRQVFIGSCAAGAFTYHVRIASGAVVLSLTSVGPDRLGERVLRRLAP